MSNRCFFIVFENFNYVLDLTIKLKTTKNCQIKALIPLENKNVYFKMFNIVFNFYNIQFNINCL